jgi:hypothetical protein
MNSHLFEDAVYSLSARAFAKSYSSNINPWEYLCNTEYTISILEYFPAKREYVMGTYLYGLVPFT